MLAAYVQAFNSDDPAAALIIGQRPTPEPEPGWVRVQIAAAALNRHDLWSLAGVGLGPADLPRILGCDGAGRTDNGREVIVHAVLGDPGWPGGQVLDPSRSIMSERYDGTLAEYVTVPEYNLIDKPPELTFREAACLPTAYLTAYRMLSKVAQAQTILVQGAGGGVGAALVQLACAQGRTVWATARDTATREFAKSLGAQAVFGMSERLPDRVEAVMETVGQATWAQSLKALRPGGAIVVCGATSGANPPADLQRVFYRDLRILGSTMGNRDDLIACTDLLVRTGIRPIVDQVLPLAETAVGLRRLAAGGVRGKIVLEA